jgi:BlaI family transcriptional regulator, penicillinase repressor
MRRRLPQSAAHTSRNPTRRASSLSWSFAVILIPWSAALWWQLRRDNTPSRSGEPHSRTSPGAVEPRVTTMTGDRHLTQRELDIMSVLWELGEANVTTVRDRVDPGLAYTSISSMLRTLELKGYVSHRRGEGKTHLYFPLIDAETAGESTLSRVLNKIYGGSPIKLLAHLAEQRKLSPTELVRMRSLLKDVPKER